MVQAADVGRDLDQVRINPESGETPTVTRSGDQVHVRLEQNGSGRGPSTLEIDLDRHVPWVLRLNGGANTETVDMRGGRLAELDLLAGATRFDLQLGPPSGTVSVHFTGGATDVALHLPTGVPAELNLGAAIPTARIDGAQRTVGSAQVIEVGDTSAPDRYAVDIAAGVSTLTVDHR